MIGDMHYKKSKTEAVRWYKKGAEAGAYFSMTNYANDLYNACGVKQDKEEAKNGIKSC